MPANAPYYTRPLTSGAHAATAAHSQLVSHENEHALSISATSASPSEPPSEQISPVLYAHRPACHVSDSTFEENHNLVELLEAATSDATARQFLQALYVDNVGPGCAASATRGDRKRLSQSPMSEVNAIENVSSSKRRRVALPTDPQLQQVDHDIDSNEADNEPSSESLLNDARAVGVHSAAALFRRSSDRTSRKYTRPPMSKLFMSLQLSPESFLQLQAQAKAYMLDPMHPERQSCVGNRGKGDTDMVKLRLFNCVRDFLSDRVGEQFFGEHVEKPGEEEAMEAARALGEDKAPNAEDRLLWPRDGNKIISLVTPLMRRMVTNERQRQYAIESRKGCAKKRDKEGSMEAIPYDNASLDRRVEDQLRTAFSPELGHCALQSQLPSPTSTCAAKADTTTQQQTLEIQDQTTSHALEPISSDTSAAKLAISRPTAPYLSHLNIFLTFAPHGSEPATKLTEKRISAGQSPHLARYDWNEFKKEVSQLIAKAKANYPELGLKDEQQCHSAGPTNLRGLAVAANALQSAHADVDAQTSPAIDAHIVTDGELLPHYVVKSVGANGWREITDEHDWYSLLREMASAIWADGVCNVLVELTRPLAGKTGIGVAGAKGEE